MGSDLYQVVLSSHHEWNKAQALQRALAYGHPYDESAAFFSQDGPWLELGLQIQSIHPDACVDWSPSFVTRVIEEGVTSWNQPGKMEYDKSPLSRLYPELWTMGFKLDAAHPPVVLVVQAEYHPDENATKTSKKDGVDLVVFLDKQYAPNLEGGSGWDSRAWPGSDNPRPAPVHKQRASKAELRPLSCSLRIGSKGVESLDGKGTWTTVAPSPWGPGRPTLFFEPGGTILAYTGALLRIGKDWGFATLYRGDPKKRIPREAHIVAGPEGTLWLGSSAGLFRIGSNGEVSKLTTKEGLAGTNVEDVCLDAEGRVVAATAGGLSMQRGDTWENLKDGLADKACRGVVLGDDGALWASGFKGVTRIAKDGSLSLFRSRQGIERAVSKVVPLPGGGVWIVTWDDPLEIGPGAERAVPSETLSRLAPSGVKTLTRSGDTVWAVTRKNVLLRLRNGAKPRAYRWMKPCLDPSGQPVEPWAIQMAPDGALWLDHGSSIFVVTPEELATLDAQAPLNQDFWDDVPVFWFPGAAPPEATAAPEKRQPAIDFTGKTVVLTGTLVMPRGEAESKLKARGAIIGSTVNAKTDYLLAGAKAGSKLAKAQSLGVTVLGEEALKAPPSEQPAQTPPPKAPKAEEGQSQKEPSATELSALFPSSGTPRPESSTLDPKLMRSLCESSPPLTAAQWKKVVKDHEKFLGSGGGGGTFQTLDVSGMVMAVYMSPGSPKGKQADLQRKGLARDVNAAGAKLSYLNGCCMVAEGVSFAGANLSHSVLTDSFLAGASFEGANLQGTDLSRTDLRGCNFQKADLRGADFENTDLTGANFTGANLEEARFPGAVLEGVIVDRRAT